MAVNLMSMTARSCGISKSRLLPELVAVAEVAGGSIDEQLALLRKIRREIENIVRAISKARSEIDLLREYRTRLIADVVTGKLDVREAAAKLPDEPTAEPEGSIDEIEEADADDIE